MINIDSETYFSILKRIIMSNDMSSIINEYKDDKEFLYSVLADILMGGKSPNSKFIKKFILRTKINDDYLIERASLLISYIKPEKFNDDYYDILEVDTNSTHEKIREKWIDLAKEYHPDKIGDSGLEKIKRINEAYEVIGNKEKRLEYDSYNIDEIPVQVSSRKTILPIKYVFYASTVVVFLLIAIFLKSVFFTDNDEEIKIAKIYEDSNVKKSYQTKINNDKSVQQSPEDVNIEGLSDFSDISNVRKKRINEYLKNNRQTKSLAPDTQSLTPNPSSPSPESRVPNPELTKSEPPKTESRVTSPEKQDPKLLTLDKKINELEKAGDFKVVIVKSNPSESVENKDTVVAKSVEPSTQSLAPSTSFPKSEIRNSDIPKPSSPSIKSRISKTESRIPKTNTYIVKSGDNLWTIARNNDTRVKVIKELNNLKSNKLKLGQKLIISTKSEFPNTELTSIDSSKQLAVKNTDKPNPESRTSNPELASSLTPKPSSPNTSSPKSESRTPNPENRIPDSKSVYSFVSQYISAYKMGDISRIKGMFSKNATENGVSITKALVSYNDIFNNKKIIKYNILISTINIKSEKSYIDGDFIITFKNLDEGNTKTSKGSINWVLDWKNDSWKIDQLNYQLKDTIFTDESL